MSNGGPIHYIWESAKLNRNRGWQKSATPTFYIGDRNGRRHMVIHESGKNISEGVVIATPEKFGAYEWGRSQNAPTIGP